MFQFARKFWATKEREKDRNRTNLTQRRKARKPGRERPSRNEELCNTHNFRGGNACQITADANRLLPTLCGDGPMQRRLKNAKLFCTRRRLANHDGGSIDWETPSCFFQADKITWIMTR